MALNFRELFKDVRQGVGDVIGEDATRYLGAAATFAIPGIGPFVGPLNVLNAMHGAPITARNTIRSGANVGLGGAAGFATGGPLGGLMGAGYGAFQGPNQPVNFGNLLQTGAIGGGLGLLGGFAGSQLGMPAGLTTGPFTPGFLGGGQAGQAGAATPGFGGQGSSFTQQFAPGAVLPQVAGQAGGQGAGASSFLGKYGLPLGLLGGGTILQFMQQRAAQKQKEEALARIERMQRTIEQKEAAAVAGSTQRAARTGRASAGARGTLDSPAAQAAIAQGIMQAQLMAQQPYAQMQSQLLPLELQAQQMGAGGGLAANPLAQLAGQYLMMQFLLGQNQPQGVPQRGK